VRASHRCCMKKIFIDYASGHDVETPTRIGEGSPPRCLLAAPLKPAASFCEANK
jgi:hypothetical protein